MVATMQSKRVVLQPHDPVRPLAVEMHGIFCHAQKVLGWNDEEFARKAGYVEDTILERTRRETTELLAGAPIPPPYWDTILAFAWALCQGQPTPEFVRWLVYLEKCHLQARNARPRVSGQTSKQRAITREMRKEGLIPRGGIQEPLEMSPSLRGFLDSHTG
jgi:hypothetical protein